MTSAESKRASVQPGDWLEVRGTPGRPSRRGQIVEVLGARGHEHYLVRWEESRESIFYPSEGTSVVRGEEALRSA